MLRQVYQYILMLTVPHWCSIYFALIELSNALKYVPFITDTQQAPCVWDISSVLAPSLRKMHDFESVHHVWFHTCRRQQPDSFCTCSCSWAPVLSHNIDLIPKLPSFKYSFVFIQITPGCLVLQLKIQNNILP